MKKIRNSFYGYSLNKMIVLGYPRNDVLTLPPLDLHRLFKDYKKIIVWYPTFRQTRGGEKYGADKALQILWNEQKACELNEYAKRMNLQGKSNIIKRIVKKSLFILRKYIILI